MQCSSLFQVGQEYEQTAKALEYGSINTVFIHSGIYISSRPVLRPNAPLTLESKHGSQPFKWVSAPVEICLIIHMQGNIGRKRPVSHLFFRRTPLATPNKD